MGLVGRPALEAAGEPTDEPGGLGELVARPDAADAIVDDVDDVEASLRHFENEPGMRRSLELWSLGASICGRFLVSTKHLLRASPGEDWFRGSRRFAGAYKFD